MKNRWLKMLSIFLCVVLIYNMLPLSVLASDVDDALRAQSSALPDDSSSGSMASPNYALETAYIVEEDISRRGEYSKEFVLNNGLRLAAVYAEPVHYEDAGQWRDIDNTLKTTSVKGIAGYTNTAGVWQVYFPQQLSGSNAISLTKDGYTVSFGMAGELTNSGNIAVASIGVASDMLAASAVKTASAQIRAVDLSAQKAAAQYEQTVLEKHSSKLAYVSVYDNTEVVYDLGGNRLKESIVISKYNASLWGYRYNLNTGGLIPVLLEDNTIELRHPETEAVVMTMPAPFMVDANDEYSYDVDVSLVQKNGSYLLSYYVPRQWLASADRAWPVVLDPVVQANNVKTNIQDISVTETEVDSNSLDSLRIGYKPGVGAMHAYLRYKALPSLSSSSVIINAKLSMTKLTTSTVGANIEVHKVNTYWQPSDITSWASKPAFNSTIEDVVFVKDPQVYTWDITNIALGWYSSTTNTLPGNAGLMFKASTDVETGGTNNYQRLCSSDGTAIPQLEITYQDTAGLEDYWDYTTVSAGRAGTGYIHNHSGNLVWVHNDMGFDGNRMPVSISHVYNPSLSTSNEYGLGYSWQTNYHQTVKAMTDGTYVWTDGDGTPHYFYSTGAGAYQDEDNLHLTLTLNGFQYVLSDQYGNESVFQMLTVAGSANSYREDGLARLIRQTNNQQTESSVMISYVASDSMQIYKITDGVGRVYSFTYASGMLDKIQFKANETASVRHTIQFAYNGSSQLSSITYADGAVTSFTYHSRNLLTRVQDIDGYNVNFTYGTTGVGKPRRVMSVTEKDSSQTGSVTKFAYGLCRTKVATYKQDQEKLHQIYYFDKWGNTVSVQDEDGQTIVSHYAPVSNPGDPTHLLAQQSTPQITGKNLITNSSFEGMAMPWTAVGGNAPTIVSSNPYLGLNSMRLSMGVNRVQSAAFTAAPGESYTFSAYIKANSTISATIGIDVNGAVVTTRSGPETALYTRLAVTYTNSTGGNQTVRAVIYGSTETEINVDCVQLEKDRTANRFNLLYDSDFDQQLAWSGWNANVTTGDAGTSAATQLNATALKIVGQTGVSHAVSQQISINQPGKKFVVSGWGKVLSLPTYENTNRTVALRATAQFEGGGTMVVTAPFGTSDGTEWQYVAAEIDTSIINKKCNYITVEIVCDNVPCTAYFDGIGLYMEPLGESYSYDAYGNVKFTEDALGNKTTYEYDSNGVRLLRVITPTKTKTEYSYDAYYNVVAVTQYDPDGTGEPTVEISTTRYAYDQYGNVIQTCQINGGQARITSATYTSNGNYLAYTTDESGNTTMYGYADDTGVLWWLMYPNDTTMSMIYYSYDSMFRLVTVQSSPHNASYTYEDDQLKTITSITTQYTMNYDLFGLRKDLKAGSYTLASYEYTDYADRYLEKLYYGSGASGTTADYVKYTYDEEGRVIKEEFHENGSSGIDSTVTYMYNDRGQVSTVTNSETGLSCHYLYDELGRVQTWHEGNGDGDEQYAAQYTYDGHGNVARIIEKINGEDYVTRYSYDSHNRPSVSYTSDEAVITTYNYDNYGAITSQTTTHNGISFNRQYTYRSVGTAAVNGSSYTRISGQVAELQISKRNISTNESSAIANYQYQYDGNGNITSVTVGGKTTTYVYDVRNQLIRENNQEANKTWTWEYDGGGNILNKKEYAYTTDTLGSVQKTVTYGYPSATSNNWNDRMTSYNGSTITYDDIGNPLSDGTWSSYTWEKGRQLASMSKSGTKWEFTYDANGLRTGRENKYYPQEKYTYRYSGGLLRSMQFNNELLVFDYDANGLPLTVTYNGDVYYYITNLQGDVVQIVSGGGTVFAMYSYDAWGNHITQISSGNNLGIYNPLRYRGYVYDRETGLYYLQSRYYNPEWGRFINADNQITGANGEALAYNLFAYCMNNPINRYDPSGHWSQQFETAVKIASIAIAVAATVVMVVAVSAASAGTATPGAVYGASIFLGAALSGINGGIANEAKGNSYFNGYCGGAIGGTIQASCGKTPIGLIVGGGVGVTVGTTITDLMNNLDPDSNNSSPREITTNAITSGGKALVTSSLTAYMGYASDLAAINGANGLMPTYSTGFGEAVKAFFGWLDDALVYIWE